MSIKNIVTLSAVVSMSAVTASAQPAVTVNKNGFAFEFRVPVESKVVKGAPFSADVVTENIQTLSDGNRIVQRSNTRVYRDSEGRVRREEDRDSVGPAISITDPVAGASFTLDSENRVAWQTSNIAGFQVTEALQKAQAQLNVELGDLQRTVEEVRKVFEARKAAEGQIARPVVEPRVVKPGRPREEAKVEQLPERVIEGVRAQVV